ncbi:MAG: 2-dehydropantoate 2-reductase [Alphaproteobacteria bacterium]
MKIGIIGAGGVGGYYGGRIAAAGRATVWFLARGAHLAAMRSAGLRILSPLGDAHVPHPNASDDAAAIGHCDAVLICTKLWSLAEAIEAAAPMVGPDTVVISMQNGVDGEPAVLARYGAARTGGGTVWIPAEIAEPGVVRQNNPMTRFIVGPLDRRPDPRIAALFHAADLPEVQAELSPDIEVDIWRKFVMLACHSGATTAMRMPIGGVLDRDRPRFEAALREAIAVGRAVCPRLPADLFETTMAGVAAMPYQMKSSMLQDLERGGRIELDWLSGAIVRLGQAHGIATPTHEALVADVRREAAKTGSMV